VNNLQCSSLVKCAVVAALSTSYLPLRLQSPGTNGVSDLHAGT